MQRSRDSDASRHTTTFSSPHQATISLVGGVPGAEKRARYQPFGAFIEDTHPLPPGQRFQLRFWLGAIEPLVVDATIRRVEEGKGIGVEFLSMTPGDYDHLQHFLHAAPL